jgi:hypothetical protein
MAIRKWGHAMGPPRCLAGLLVFLFGQMHFHGKTTQVFPQSIPFTSYAKKKEMRFLQKTTSVPWVYIHVY